MTHKIFLVLFFCIVVTLTASAQKITVSLQHVKLEKVFDAITQQTGLAVAYSRPTVNPDRIVSINADNEELSSVLSRLLTSSKITFEIGEKRIYLKEKGPSDDSKSKSGKSKKVTGTIVDQTGEPIIGASVVVKGSTTGTITDVDGNFILETPEKGIVTISYIGYKTIDLSISDKNLSRITLIEDSKMIDEVVVVGYGTQKKVNLTGAVSVISAKDINGRPVASAAMALQGVDPGLNISINSGSPDSGYDIDIRGVASINGGTPLILVDGVESSLSRINANDIESVSILKDASASAIYGAKASSGVVLLTTKSGLNSGKAKITYAGRFGVGKNTVSTDFITTGYWSAKINDMFLKPYLGYGYTSYTDEDYEQLYARINDKTENPDRPWVIQQEDGSYKYYANFDWYNYMYRQNSPQQEHNIAIQGGNQKIDYYVSGRYYSQDGIIKIKHDTYDNYAFRAKIKAEIRPWLHFSTNNSFYSSKRFFPGTSSVPNLIKKSYVHALACVVPTNPDGSIVYINPNSNTTATVMDGFSAILINDKHRNTNYDREFVTNNRFDIDVLKGLVLTGEYSYSFRNREYNNRSSNVPYSQYAGVTEVLTTSNFSNFYQEQHYRVQNHNVNLYATYKNTFGNVHNLQVTAGTQYETYQSRSLKVKRLGVLSDNLDDFNLATGEVATLTGGVSEYATLGYFGRVNYDFSSKYLIELSGRFDGSSRFKANNRWGFFPSASLGWRASEEKFFKPLENIINNAKLRFSVGSLGNQQVSNYAYIDEIDTSYKLKDYTIDGSSTLGYAQESAPTSSNLTWETITTYDLGLDLSFLNNRLTLTGDVYIRDTKDMLLQGVNLPAVYGAASPMINGADMSTKGWEIYVRWNDKFNLMNKPFNYQLSAGIGDYKTKITKYSNPTKQLNNYYEGQTLGEIWGYTTGGLFKSDEEAASYGVDQSFLNQRINASVGEPGLRAGDLKYLDIDGDNVISTGANTADNPGDRRVIGNTLPRYSYTFSMNAQWNGFDLSAFFQGIGHQDWYPGNYSMSFWGPYCRPYASFIPENFMNDVWSETNPNAYFPRPRGYEATNENYSLGSANDRYLQNIAYLRLKNLTIGYTLPVWKKLFEELRVYVSGENLFYFSPLKKHSKYIDPEQAKSSNTQDENTGLAYNFSKVFSVGVNITF